MCLIYTILSLRSWAAWAVFRDALNTSTSHNYESHACWHFKEEESVFRVIARAREPWKPICVGVSELEEREAFRIRQLYLHAWCGSACTWREGRGPLLTCPLGLSRAGEGRSKPGCVGKTELTPYRKQAVSPQFQPPAILKKNILCSQIFQVSEETRNLDFYVKSSKLAQIFQTVSWPK